MSLKETIENDMKQALKQGDKFNLSVLRMVLAEIKNDWIKKGSELTDDEVLELLARQMKLRRQSITEFEKANRSDLAEKEAAEIVVIQKYLPEQLSDEALSEIVSNTIESIGATSLKDMGKVMSAVMSEVKGAAEGQKVSSLVKERLSSL